MTINFSPTPPDPKAVIDKEELPPYIGFKFIEMVRPARANLLSIRLDKEDSFLLDENEFLEWCRVVKVPEDVLRRLWNFRTAFYSFDTGKSGELSKEVKSELLMF